MGSGWSSSGDDARHIYLNTWTNPRIQQQRVRVPIRMVLTGGLKSSADMALCIANDPKARQRLLHRVVEKMEPCQKAIVLRVYAFYIHNEFDHPISIQLNTMFTASGASGNEEIMHPDDTGSVCIFCPANVSLQPTGVDQILYRPRHLLDDTIRSYAGLEKAILEPRAHPLPGAHHQAPVEVFEETDPLVEFIVTHAKELQLSKGDISALDPEGAPNGKRYYQIRDEFLNHIRDYFRSTVFDEFRYTRFEEMNLQSTLSHTARESLFNRFGGPRSTNERPELFVVLEFSYLLVTPGDLLTRHRQIRIK